MSTFCLTAYEIHANGLCRGDLATVIEFYVGRTDQEPGYELEVFNAVGVISVREPQIEAPRQEYRLCVRSAALTAQTTI